MSWGTAVFNSFDANPNSESTVGSRVVYGALGVAEGAFEVVTGVADLTKFVVQLTCSSEYRSKISEQLDQLNAHLNKHG